MRAIAALHREVRDTEDKAGGGEPSCYHLEIILVNIFRMIPASQLCTFPHSYMQLCKDMSFLSKAVNILAAYV